MILKEGRSLSTSSLFCCERGKTIFVSMRKLFDERDEEGFTLVEMVVALMVIGVLAVAAYPSMWFSLQMLETTKTTTSATTTVQEVIEQIRSQPTCVNLGVVTAALESSFQDSRGINYSVNVEYLNPSGTCEDASALPLRISATRDRDGYELVSQDVQIFIPPAGGSFDLGG